MPLPTVFESFYESLRNATGEVVGFVSGHKNKKKEDDESNSETTELCREIVDLGQNIVEPCSSADEWVEDYNQDEHYDEDESYEEDDGNEPYEADPGPSINPAEWTPSAYSEQGYEGVNLMPEMYPMEEEMYEDTFQPQSPVVELRPKNTELGFAPPPRKEEPPLKHIICTVKVTQEPVSIPSNTEEKPEKEEEKEPTREPWPKPAPALPRPCPADQPSWPQLNAPEVKSCVPAETKPEENKQTQPAETAQTPTPTHKNGVDSCETLPSNGKSSEEKKIPNSYSATVIVPVTPPKPPPPPRQAPQCPGPEKIICCGTEILKNPPQTEPQAIQQKNQSQMPQPFNDAQKKQQRHQMQFSHQRRPMQPQYQQQLPSQYIVGQQQQQYQNQGGYSTQMQYNHPPPPGQNNQQPMPKLMPNQHQYGQAPIPGQQQYGQLPMPGQQPYGQPPMINQQQYESPPMQGQQQYGQAPIQRSTMSTSQFKGYRRPSPRKPKQVRQQPEQGQTPSEGIVPAPSPGIKPDQINGEENKIGDSKLNDKLPQEPDGAATKAPPKPKEAETPTKPASPMDSLYPQGVECRPVDGVIPKVMSCGDMAAAAAAMVAKSGTGLTRKAVLSAIRSPGGNFIRIGGLSGFAAVAMGAYAAHVFYEGEEGSDGGDDEHKREVFNIANRYHFIHSLALLATPLFRCPLFTGTLLTLGIIFFCGSCYVHALTGNQDVRRATPYGGVLLIAAWLSMLL